MDPTVDYRRDDSNYVDYVDYVVSADAHTDHSGSESDTAASDPENTVAVTNGAYADVDAATCCSICLEALAEPAYSPVIELLCRHQYHESCFARWLRHQIRARPGAGGITCPLCRDVISVRVTNRPDVPGVPSDNVAATVAATPTTATRRRASLSRLHRDARRRRRGSASSSSSSSSSSVTSASAATPGPADEMSIVWTYVCGWATKVTILDALALTLFIVGVMMLSREDYSFSCVMFILSGFSMFASMVARLVEHNNERERRASSGNPAGRTPGDTGGGNGGATGGATGSVDNADATILLVHMPFRRISSARSFEALEQRGYGPRFPQAAVAAPPTTARVTYSV